MVLAGNAEGWTLEQQGDGRDGPRMNFRNTGGLPESVAFISAGSKPMVPTPNVPLKFLLLISIEIKNFKVVARAMKL